jgi:hypothetical protein
MKYPLEIQYCKIVVLNKLKSNDSLLSQRRKIFTLVNRNANLIK